MTKCTLEHRRVVSTGNVRNANAVHCMKTNHSMDWNAAGVVDRASRWRKKRIKESVHQCCGNGSW